jgi:alpha-beta hydrolase superfamily lysophospholipase
MGKARAGIALATAVTAFYACSSFGSLRTGSRSEGSAELTFAAAPRGLPTFYGAPDPIPDVAPGTLFKSEKVAAPHLHGTLYRVMYASRSLQNHTVAVTGIVMIPKRPAPAAGYPVVTWAHGTTGLADQCAPSISPGTGGGAINDLLDRGWAFTATDYAGAGTPGVLPYLGGVIAARNTIDIVRAARNMSEAHASTEYAVWGYSQGGQAAMFALDIGAPYAPELRQVGVVAGAPPSQLSSLYAHLKASKYSHYLLMLVVGLNAEYGDSAAPLDQVLTPAGIALVPTLRERCLSIPGLGLRQPVQQLLQAKLRGASIAKTFKADPFTITKWRKVIEANDPQYLKTATHAPLLIVQGGADEQIPAVSSQVLAKQQCSIGQNVERWLYPGENHAWTLVVSVADVTRWIGDRFAGGAEPDRYAPKGRPHVRSTLCTA